MQSQREDREGGAHPRPRLAWIPNSRLSKGLKSWVVIILHVLPSRHITIMLMTSAAVSF